MGDYFSKVEFTEQIKNKTGTIRIDLDSQTLTYQIFELKEKESISEPTFFQKLKELVFVQDHQDNTYKNDDGKVLFTYGVTLNSKECEQIKTYCNASNSWDNTYSNTESIPEENKMKILVKAMSYKPTKLVACTVSKAHPSRLLYDYIKQNFLKTSSIKYKSL